MKQNIKISSIIAGIMNFSLPTFAQNSVPNLGIGSSILIPVILMLIIIMLIGFVFVTRYKRCPSDKILVIYGKTGKGSAKCVHGGAAFVWPVIQDYQYMDLSPINIDVDLRGALSKQNIRVNVPSRFTIAISNHEGIMQTAAERLLGKTIQEIKEIAQDIIFGQLRLVVATMDIEEINADRDKFLKAVMDNVEGELKKIGLTLINVNVTDIQDESGYIEALGKKASSEAINAAKVEVAEEERKGAIGESNADQQKRVEVARLNSQAEIGEANASADAVKGKNIAEIEIARSDSDRRSSVAEANKTAIVSEKTAQAEAERVAYIAQQKAEEARAESELARKRANEVVQAKIDKEQAIISAEARAEKFRVEASGEADAILKKYEAEAEGIRKLLEAQGDGFDKLVKAANGDPQAAIGMLLIERLQDLAQIQADAIKNIKMDKVTIFDGGDGKGISGLTNGLYKSIPALQDFLEQSGLGLPQYLATQSKKQVSTPKEEKKNNNVDS